MDRLKVKVGNTIAIDSYNVIITKVCEKDEGEKMECLEREFLPSFHPTR